MANPQLEDGHLRIANEIWRRWTKMRVPGEAEQVLKAIVDKTYGWNKKEDWISISQLSEATGISEPNACRGVRTLLKMRMIVKKDNGGKAIYSLQKDYDLWKALSKKTRGQKATVKKDNRGLSKKTDTKNQFTKNQIIPAKPDSIKKTDSVYNLKWEYVDKRFHQLTDYQATPQIIGKILAWAKDVGEAVTAIYKMGGWTTEAVFMGAVRKTLRERNLWSDDNWQMVKNENARFERWLENKEGAKIEKLFK